MNQREPTSAPIGAGQALPCLALLLLTLLLGVRLWARPALPSVVVPAKPYLVALGSPPLRFEEPAPPPDLVTRPPASAPPVPTEATDSEVANDTAPALVASTAPMPSEPVLPAATEAVGEPTEESEEVIETVRTPQPILADDVRPQARPEDFLPYFQIPTPNGDATVIVPVPRTPDNGTPLPPSSATYTQSP